MAETIERKRRSVAFLLVILMHGLFIEVLIRGSKPTHFMKSEFSDALLLTFLPRALPLDSNAPKTESPSKGPSKSIAPKKKTLPAWAPPVPIVPQVDTAPAAPPIDWQGELELAARNRTAETDKDTAYRDLSNSLSPSQLDWLKQHRMEPARPGITWKSPRVEVTKDGLPIVHINDHCVLVPLFLIPMVFCTIGHIEPNGDLFNHMHDPPQR